MGRPTPCQCQECCYCYEYQIDSWNAGDWEVRWFTRAYPNPGPPVTQWIENDFTPRQTETVTFSGTSVSIQADCEAVTPSITAIGEQYPVYLCCLLIYKPSKIVHSHDQCQWRWGLDATINAATLVGDGTQTDANIPGGTSVCPAILATNLRGVLWNPRSESIVGQGDSHLRLIDEFDWRYKFNNKDDVQYQGYRPLTPAQHNLCKVALLFEMQACEPGASAPVETIINDGASLYVGACHEPRYEFNVATPQQAFRLRSEFALQNSSCGGCDGSLLYIPSNPPNDWVGPLTATQMLYLSLLGTSTSMQSAGVAGFKRADQYMIGHYSLPRKTNATPIPGTDNKTSVYCDLSGLDWSGGGTVPPQDGGGYYVWTRQQPGAGININSAGKAILNINHNRWVANASEFVGLASGDAITFNRIRSGLDCECTYPDAITVSVD